MKYLPQSEYSHLSQNEITTPSPLPHDHSLRRNTVLFLHPIQIHHNQFDQHSTLYTTTSSNNCTSYHTIYNTTPSQLISSHLISIIHTSPHSILSYPTTLSHLPHPNGRYALTIQYYSQHTLILSHNYQLQYRQ
jgi:hypothetical protein